MDEQKYIDVLLEQKRKLTQQLLLLKEIQVKLQHEKEEILKKVVEMRITDKQNQNLKKD